MDISNMKNIIVLKNLPSNLVDEAIVVLKQNKKIKKYQYVDSEGNKKINDKVKDKSKDANVTDEKISNEHILKEAEMIISSYISRIENNSNKSKKEINQIEKKYRKSIRLNFLLLFTTIVSIILSMI